MARADSRTSSPGTRDSPGGADVIVVGGGPAGAMAALTLARRSVRVLLLDRHRFPRDKPCGGGIRYGLFRRFPALAAELARTVRIHQVRRVLMESPSGARVLAELEGPLYVTLRRLEFDAALVGAARARGATVIEGVRVTDLERTAAGVVVRALDGRAFRARLVIGADGVNSLVARAAGLSRGFGDGALAIDTMEETPLAALGVTDPETMYVAYGYRGWAGYGYVFPKAEHVDAGVGFLVSFYKKALGDPPWEYHRAFIAEAAAKGVVRGGSRRENFRAYRLPLGGPLARTWDDSTLLVGDAAGFVNAYTGEGIYYATVTGELAAETAAEALAAGGGRAAALARYQFRWQAEIGEELADSVRIQRRLFASPDLVDRLIRAAAMDRTLARRLARVALGEERLRDRRFELAWRFTLASLRARLGGRRGPVMSVTPPRAVSSEER